MQATVLIEDELLARARELTGIQDNCALLHEGLKALVERETSQRLAAMGGSEPGLEAATRRRADLD